MKLDGSRRHLQRKRNIRVHEGASTIDRDGLPGDERGFLATKKRAHVGDVLRRCESAHRSPARPSLSS